MGFTLVSTFLWCTVKIVKACPERAFNLEWEIVFPLPPACGELSSWALCGWTRETQRQRSGEQAGTNKEVRVCSPGELRRWGQKKNTHPSLLLTGIPQIICQKDRAKVSNTSFRLKWHGTHYQVRDWEPPAIAAGQASHIPASLFLWLSTHSAAKQARSSSTSGHSRDRNTQKFLSPFCQPCPHIDHSEPPLHSFKSFVPCLYDSIFSPDKHLQHFTQTFSSNV